MNRLNLSRRALLHGGALAGMSALLGGSRAFARGGIEPQWPAVTAMVESTVASGKVAGMIAALGWRAEAPGFVARGREGFDDPDPCGPGSLFRAYSMTKPVTGMAAMILIDEGRMGLDQPLADFVPEFAQMQVALDPAAGLEARPAQGRITIRHLLTHTSGLGYAVVGKDKVSDELGRLGINAGVVSRQRLPGIAAMVPTPLADEFLRRTASVPLRFEPGTRWAYSMGLDVLGLVIERIVGQPLDRFLAERIFGPCGMHASTFRVEPGALRHLTTNYALSPLGPLPIDRPATSIYQDPQPFALGGAGLVTTPTDYDRFLAMLVNRGVSGRRRVLSERAVALGTADLLPAGADLSGTFVAGQRFGAGGVVGAGRDEGLFGWSGAAGTVGYAQLRFRLRASLFTQYMPSEQLPVQREFPKAVGADVARLVQP